MWTVVVAVGRKGDVISARYLIPETGDWYHISRMAGLYMKWDCTECHLYL